MNTKSMKPLVVALGIASTLAATPAAATVKYYNWDGFFTLLWNDGGVLSNTSIDQKFANQFQTPIVGTLALDSDTGAGIASISASIAPFDFFNNEPGKPVELHDISLQLVGDGLGGAGTLMVGNMLADWDGNNDMPVSIVWDAAGLFIGANNGDLDDGILDQAEVANYGATPASDGTYANATWGYLNLGPTLMATTSWNTTPNCTTGVDCTGSTISGVLPLVVDTAINLNDYDLTTPTYSDLANDGIGGSPMLSGPFIGINPNFDITRLEYTGEDNSLQIAAFGEVLGLLDVPVPAAVWLFGSGLSGLVLVARRKKSEV